MNRSVVGLIILFFVSISTHAQIRFSGSLIDLENEPVAFATIQLKDSAGNTLSYTISNDEGRFFLECKEHSQAVLLINHLNYNTFVDTLFFNMEPTDIERVITLNPKENKLAEVLVKGPEREASVSEDTIRYNLQLNTTGTERSLGEIINKMPGLSVNENGDIMANGKKVENLLVDGKSFFGDNHKMATQHLNPEMVAGLTLIQNYQPNSMLAGKSGSQEKALNIELSEEYRGKWTGDLKGLGAWENRYEGEFNSYIFGKDFSLGWLNSANNTGTRHFSLEDYVKMSLGSQKKLFESNLSNARQLDNIPSFLLDSSTPQSRRSEFSAFNYIYQPNENLKIQGYSLLNNGREKFSAISNKRFIAGNERIEFTDSIESSADYLFAQNHLNLTWQATENYQVDYQVNFNPVYTQNRENIVAEAGEMQRNSLHTEEKIHNLPFNQQLNQLWSLNDNSFLGASSYFARNFEKENKQLQNEIPLFDYDDSEIHNRRDLSSDIFQQGLYYVQYFGDSRLLLKSEWKNEQQDLSNTISFPSTSEGDVASDSVEYKVNHFIQTAEWLKSKGDWQYQLRLNWQQSFFQEANDQSDARNLLPEFHLKYAFAPSHYIKLQWGQNLEFAPLYMLNGGTYIDDYRNIQRGTSLRYNDFYKSSTAGFNYFNFSLFNGILVFLNSSYKYADDSFVRSTDNRISYNEVSFAQSGSMYEWTNLAHLEWRISSIQHKIKTNANWVQSESPLLLNEDLLRTKAENLNTQFAVSSQYKNSVINYEAGVSFSDQRFEFSSGQRNSIKIWTPFFGVSGQLANGFIYRSRLDYQDYQQLNAERTLWLWDAELEYRPLKSQWSIILEGRDLLNLNTSQLINVYNEANVLSTQIHQRLRGYVGIGVSYTWK